MHPESCHRWPIRKNFSLRRYLASLVLGTQCVIGPSLALASLRCELAGGSSVVLTETPPGHFSMSVMACRPVSVAAVPAHEPLRIASPQWQVLTAVRSAPAVRQHPDAARWNDLIEQAALRHGLSPTLLHAVIRVESGYNPQARSPKGALGLMQVMPATGTRFGIDRAEQLLVPAVNIDVGSRYLRWLVDRFGDRLDLALAAYNAGEGAVQRYGNRIPPFPETLDYVERVTDRVSAAER